MNRIEIVAPERLRGGFFGAALANDREINFSGPRLARCLTQNRVGRVRLMLEPRQPRRIDVEARVESLWRARSTKSPVPSRHHTGTNESLRKTRWGGAKNLKLNDMNHRALKCRFFQHPANNRCSPFEANDVEQ